MDKVNVRVRFAPSPTGELHIGSIRTVVFNWLFARKMGGQFVLRIEDTDRTRYQPSTIRAIVDGLRWLGLEIDEGPGLEELRNSGIVDADRYAIGGPCGPYVQSERIALYKEVAETLVERGWAYRCTCRPERLQEVREMQREHNQPMMYDRHCRDLPLDAISPDEVHVVRLKVPLQGKTTVHDLVKGDVAFDNGGLDDQVLMKSDGFPTYHLAVVVDDHHMRISHVIRGDHWIASTPKRILLYHALGWEPPVYCHVPLVNGVDGKPLSKRHGSVSIIEFRNRGYLPEAMLNFLAFVGWAPGKGEEREVFSREELIARFDLTRINKAPAVFSYKKLDWMNGIYIRNLPTDVLLDRILPYWQAAGYVPDPPPSEWRQGLLPIVPLVQERLKTLDEVVGLTEFLFRDIDRVPAENLIGKKMTLLQSLTALSRARSLLAAVEHFEAESTEGSMRVLARELSLKAGQLFGILRWAVTGQRVAPPLFSSLAVLGRARTLERLDNALATLTETEQPV